MRKHITIPRLGSPRTDHDLIARIRLERAKGVTDTFYTSDRKGRRIRVQRQSDADLYQRVMAARGIPVRIGAS